MTFQAVAGVLGILAFGAKLMAASNEVPKVEQEPRYDPANVVELTAVITEVREVAKGSPLNGVNLVVRTDSDATVGVYVAPVAFLKNFDITFAKGNSIHIVGSKVKVNGGSVVLGREVRKDSTTLYLRNRNGDPYWQAGDKPAS